MTNTTKTADPLFNLVIICWLFIPLLIILFLFFISMLNVLADFSLTQLNLLDIFQNLLKINIISNNLTIQTDNLPFILAIIGGFLIYCYIFDLIKKKGFEIFSNENQKTEFFSTLPFLFLLSLVLLYFLCYFSPEFLTKKQDEIMLVLIFLLILFISYVCYILFNKYVNTYEGIKRITSIRDENTQVPFYLANNDELISISFDTINIFTSIIFILTFIVFFIWLKYNLNFLTFLIIETSLLYLHIIYSTIRLSPKRLCNIKYKPYMNHVDESNVFIILDSSKGHYGILSKDDRFFLVMKDVISHIIPIKIKKEHEIVRIERKEKDKWSLIKHHGITAGKNALIKCLLYFTMSIGLFIVFIFASRFSLFALFISIVVLITMATLFLKFGFQTILRPNEH